MLQLLSYWGRNQPLSYWQETNSCPLFLHCRGSSEEFAQSLERSPSIPANQTWKFFSTQNEPEVIGEASPFFHPLMNFTSEFKSTSPLKEVHSEENPLQRLTYRLFRTNIDESKHLVCNAYINIHHPLKLLTSSDVFRHFFVRSSFQEVSGGTKSIFVQINGLMGA